MQEALRCSACGDAIGAYEPVFVIEPGGARSSSLAREPEIASTSDPVVHLGCAVQGRAESLGLSAAEATHLSS